jgi:hypothetical protein
VVKVTLRSLGYGSLVAFIRDQPSDCTAEDIVARLAALGWPVTVKQVHKAWGKGCLALLTQAEELAAARRDRDQAERLLLQLIRDNRSELILAGELMRWWQDHRDDDER